MALKAVDCSRLSDTIRMVNTECARLTFTESTFTKCLKQMITRNRSNWCKRNNKQKQCLAGRHSSQSQIKSNRVSLWASSHSYKSCRDSRLTLEREKVVTCRLMTCRCHSLRTWSNISRCKQAMKKTYKAGRNSRRKVLDSLHKRSSTRVDRGKAKIQMETSKMPSDSVNRTQKQIRATLQHRSKLPRVPSLTSNEIRWTQNSPIKAGSLSLSRRQPVNRTVQKLISGMDFLKVRLKTTTAAVLMTLSLSMAMIAKWVPQTIVEQGAHLASTEVSQPSVKVRNPVRNRTNEWSGENQVLARE